MKPMWIEVMKNIEMWVLMTMNHGTISTTLALSTNLTETGFLKCQANHQKCHYQTYYKGNSFEES